MKYAPWGAVLAVLSLAASVPAQYPFGPATGLRGGVGFTFGVPGRYGVTGYYTRPLYYPAYAYVPPFGYGFVPATTIILQPVTPLYVPNFPVVPPLNERADAGVGQPRNQAQPKQFQPPPPAQMPAPGMPGKLPPPNPAPLLAPMKEANKNAENARLLKLGKEAFALGQFGRAAERFQEAAKVLPDNAESLFLLAQAQFALGKYVEATASICAGMKLKPDWPNSQFDPRELNDKNPVAHVRQLDMLRDAVEANPNEPALLFLYGY
jgi:hypothetical protein